MGGENIYRDEILDVNFEGILNDKQDDYDLYSVCVRRKGIELFKEETKVYGLAGAVAYNKLKKGHYRDINNLQVYTTNKAKVRYLFGLFRKEKIYKEEISSDKVSEIINDVDNDTLSEQDIQRIILQGLCNMRRKFPKEYSVTPFAYEGLCSIFDISAEQYLYNGGILLEEGAIEKITLLHLSSSPRAIYITSAGIKYLNSLTKPLQPKSNIEDNAVVTVNINYDIAVSFAGEDREKVEPLVNRLNELGITVFYDKFEQASLWGKDLYVYLNDIYKNKAKYCILFVSKHYKKSYGLIMSVKQLRQEHLKKIMSIYYLSDWTIQKFPA